MKISRFLSLFVALTAVSCRYPNEFKSTQTNAPHAILRGTAYPHAGKVFATHINGHPTSFWRASDVFQIPPGTNTFKAAYSDLQETLGYKVEQVVAIAGREYVIARKREKALASAITATPHQTTTNAWVVHDQRDRVTIHEIEASGLDHVVAEAPREDYMFGLSSPDAAIAEYHRKNP
jgi:hypothetical protein